MTTSNPETAEIKCPQCSNVCEVRGGEHTFCPTCDFPLFWADPVQAALRPAVRSAAVGEEAMTEEPAEEPDEGQEGAVDDLDVQTTDIICRNCALRNPGDRTYCMRCGHELPPPEEWFNPDEPVEVVSVDDPPLWRSLVAPFFALVAIAGVTLAVLHFGFDVFSSNPVVAVTVVNSGADSAHSISLVLEGDPPVPVIAHRDAAGNALRVIVCENLECSSTKTSTAVDSEGVPGIELAMDVVAGGPIIVYRREPTNSLVAVNCGSIECDNRTGARGFFPVDEDEDVGYAPAIDVTGGVPVIVYTTGEGNLRLAYLCRESCNESGGVIITELPGQTDAGAPFSIAIPRAASPYITYWDTGTQSLSMLRCLNVICSERSPDRAVTLGSGELGQQTAMVIDGTSLAPLVAFRDAANGDLLLLSCGDEECTPENRLDLVALDRGARGTADHDVGHDIAMARGPNGHPVLAYRDETDGVLMMAICTESPCTRDTVVIEVLDDGGTGAEKVSVGYANSIAITGDTAVVAYSDADRASLRIARVDLSRLLERASKTAATVDSSQPATQ